MKTNKIFLFAFIATLFSFIGCSDDTAKEGNALKNYVGLEADKYVGVVLTETVNVEAKIVASEASNVDRTFPFSFTPKLNSSLKVNCFFQIIPSQWINIS